MTWRPVGQSLVQDLCHQVDLHTSLPHRGKCPQISRLSVGRAGPKVLHSVRNGPARHRTAVQFLYWCRVLSPHLLFLGSLNTVVSEVNHEVSHSLPPSLGVAQKRSVRVQFRIIWGSSTSAGLPGSGIPGPDPCCTRHPTSGGELSDVSLPGAGLSERLATYGGSPRREMLVREEEHAERQYWVTGEDKEWELLLARQEASGLICNAPSGFF